MKQVEKGIGQLETEHMPSKYNRSKLCIRTAINFSTHCVVTTSQCDKKHIPTITEKQILPKATN